MVASPERAKIVDGTSDDQAPSPAPGTAVHAAAAGTASIKPLNLDPVILDPIVLDPNAIFAAIGDIPL